MHISSWRFALLDQRQDRLRSLNIICSEHLYVKLLQPDIWMILFLSAFYKRINCFVFIHLSWRVIITFFLPIISISMELTFTSHRSMGRVHFVPSSFFHLTKKSKGNIVFIPLDMTFLQRQHLFLPLFCVLFAVRVYHICAMNPNIEKLNSNSWNVIRTKIHISPLESNEMTHQSNTHIHRLFVFSMPA